MELERDLFDQIVTSLGATSTDEGPPQCTPEQRRGGRLALTADVLVAPHGVVSAQPRKVQLRSLSRGGAAILDSAGTMHTGDKALLFLPRKDQKVISVVCLITNSRLMMDGRFRLGMQFLSRAEQTGASMLRGVNGLITRPLSAGPTSILDEIATSGTRPNDDASGNGNGGNGASGNLSGREERVEINVQSMFAPYSDGRTGPVSFVTVKDISRNGGVCIVSPEELARGDQFVLQVPREKGKPLTLICTAVDCRRLDDTNFRIGARFEARLLQEEKSPSGGGLLNRLRRWLAA
jgi:hypothetical protein